MASRRVPELDGVRGIAALLVVTHHLWPNVNYFGWAAVDLFFVLSGYLITGIILENGGQRGFLKAFYARRTLRIWPIYYLTILVLLTCTDPQRGAWRYYVFYFQNVPSYWGGVTPIWHEFVHTWTLALEEQFYLLWPGLLLVIRRPLSVAATASSIAALCMIARWLGVPINLLLGRCDGFAMGALLACLFAANKIAWIRRSTIAATVAGVAALIWGLLSSGSPFRQVFRPEDITAATLFSFAIVAAVTLNGRGRWTAWLRTRPMSYLGTISYGLYLYHYPIMMRGYSLTVRLGIHRRLAEPFFFGFLTILVAVLSWHFVESPILRLKERVPYRPAVRSAPSKTAR